MASDTLFISEKGKILSHTTTSLKAQSDFSVERPLIDSWTLLQLPTLEPIAFP